MTGTAPNVLQMQVFIVRDAALAVRRQTFVNIVDHTALNVVNFARTVMLALTV